MPKAWTIKDQLIDAWISHPFQEDIITRREIKTMEDNAEQKEMVMEVIVKERSTEPDRTFFDERVYEMQDPFNDLSY